MFLSKNKYLIAWLGILTISVGLNACSYSAKASRELLAEARKNPYDIVVVPGIPLDKGKWSRIMKARVYWSKYLYDNGLAKNIMYSGGAVYTPYYEGEVMAMYAEAVGIDSNHIFIENRAEHSTENIYYSYQKAKQLGFKRIALASDPFQTRMLRNFTHKKVARSVGMLPANFDTLRAMEPNMSDPVIEFELAKADNFVALPDREGFFKRFRGTRGANIDYNAYK